MATGKAIVLLSGGLDSATTAAIARSDGFEVVALSFDYGQRHKVELDAARAVATALDIRQHLIARIDLRMFGKSALTADIPVPKTTADCTAPLSTHGPNATGASAEPIPITYVPARNTIFLAYALACAETQHARDIYIGVNAVDYSGYPDCRPHFIQAFQQVANTATRAAVEGHPPQIHAPLIHLTKPQIIRRGLELGVDYSLTRTCYDPDPDGAACGQCESCRLRLVAFARLGIPDPAPYRHHPA